MNLLLDTHIVLWSLSEPQKLTERIAEVLENEKNTLYVSSVTIWEILVLSEKSKISLHADDLPDFLRKAFRKIPFIELPINNEIAIKSSLIDLPQQDPADRFIGATALFHDMILVTVDKLFCQNNELKILK